MEHSFDTVIAQEYGINCAVILKHIYYWVQKNEANGKNIYAGKVWTYNSVKAFETIFPYLTNKQIRVAIDKLSENGLIEVGCYNGDPYDKTKWYTITEKGKSIIQKGQTELPSRANRSDSEGKSYNIYIDNDNTDSNTSTSDIKPDNKKKIVKRKDFQIPTIEEIEQYCIDKEYAYVDPEGFYYFYDSKDWMVGKNKMTKWRSSVARWNRDNRNAGKQKNKALVRKIKEHQEQQQLLEYQAAEEAWS